MRVLFRCGRCYLLKPTDAGCCAFAKLAVGVDIERTPQVFVFLLEATGAARQPEPGKLILRVLRDRLFKKGGRLCVLVCFESGDALPDEVRSIYSVLHRHKDLSKVETANTTII
jgi:hypothetical protein